MNGYVVYLDVLFLLNFSVDFLLLAATGKMLHRPLALVRLLSAALFGAVYGAAIVLPLPQWLYRPSFAVLISLFLLVMAFPIRGMKALLRMVSVFYLLSFVLAGCTEAFSQLIYRHGIHITEGEVMRWTSLAAAVPVVVILARRGWGVLQQSFRREDYRCRVEIRVAGHTAFADGFIDTGNDLKEPFSGTPVLIMELRQAAPLFPTWLRVALQENKDRPDLVMTASPHTADGWSSRLRLIPFASVGRPYGTLLGFRPDATFLHYRGQVIESHSVVGISCSQREKPLPVIVNPELLMGTEQTEREALSA